MSNPRTVDSFGIPGNLQKSQIGSHSESGSISCIAHFGSSLDCFETKNTQIFHLNRQQRCFAFPGSLIILELDGCSCYLDVRF